MSTSSGESFIRTLISTPGLFIRRCASRWTCFPCCSRLGAPRVGWPNGSKCWKTQIKRSRARARFIWANEHAITWPLDNAKPKEAKPEDRDEELQNNRGRIYA